jgi:alpha-L-arabinofuranosidase
LDGIGPVDRRPARLNLTWDWIEPNCIVLLDRFAYRMPKARVE